MRRTPGTSRESLAVKSGWCRLGRSVCSTAEGPRQTCGSGGLCCGKEVPAPTGWRADPAETLALSVQKSVQSGACLPGPRCG